MENGGARRGAGRPHGARSKSTIELRLIAERNLAEAKMAGKKLGKEILEKYMVLFDEAADYHHVMAAADGSEKKKKFHQREFEKNARLAVDAARDLAPF